MRVMVNGEPRELAPGTTVAGLLQALGVDPRLVTVELNLDILGRDRYPTAVLGEADTVEIVQMVGGGA